MVRFWFSKRRVRVSRERIRTRNPYFRSKKKKGFPLVPTAAMFFLFLLAGMGVFLSHPTFQISEVLYEGVEEIPQDLLQEKVEHYLDSRFLLVFPQRNYWLFSQTKLASALKDVFSVRGLLIEREDHRLTIRISERHKAYRWQSAGVIFDVDGDGIVIREEREGEAEEGGGGSPLFIDANNVSVQVGSAVLKPEEIMARKSIEEMCQLLGIQTTSTIIDRVTGSLMRVSTVDGYELFFTPTDDIQKQLRLLQTVYTHEITDPSKLSYIDVRFGDRVYYK
ncbi:hypothetical protein HYV73_03665 [Candidatus Uhrbacteria bacterium]|nr:hypothetical protein [Candidatus Uhrbacteria bacterium]